MRGKTHNITPTYVINIYGNHVAFMNIIFSNTLVGNAVMFFYLHVKRLGLFKVLREALYTRLSMRFPNKMFCNLTSRYVTLENPSENEKVFVTRAVGYTYANDIRSHLIGQLEN